MTDLAQERFAVPERDRRKRLTIDVDLDVHRELKLAATERDQSIRDYVIDALLLRMRGGNEGCREAS